MHRHGCMKWLMNAWINWCMDSKMHELMDGWMDEKVEGKQMDGCACVRACREAFDKASRTIHNVESIDRTKRDNYFLSKLHRLKVICSDADTSESPYIRPRWLSVFLIAAKDVTNGTITFIALINVRIKVHKKISVES